MGGEVSGFGEVICVVELFSFRVGDFGLLVALEALKNAKILAWPSFFTAAVLGGAGAGAGRVAGFGG